eukprot:gnl/MRDRNA2_/MRDRNA2_63625_c0_seq2.p1 gnl/MRDRNA2_/MRDRNA2_63625_c0~~gnl/MRDRNA2_/MRDRNA2_63625_c0_seq2.p1  ORF type:complete len:209 (-),score=38.32 gnl/MRDRNA2_/MRDRNA2_63625_c0_seq2:121-747(-)
MLLLDRMIAWLDSSDWEEQSSMFFQMHCVRFCRDRDNIRQEQAHETYALYKEFSIDADCAFEGFLEAENLTQSALLDALEAEGAYERQDFNGSILRSLVAQSSYKGFLEVMLLYADEWQANGGQQVPLQSEEPTFSPVLPEGFVGLSCDTPSTQDSEQRPSVCSDLHEVEVTVPDGVLPGQSMEIDFLGLKHQVVVPEGSFPGSLLRA